jgi:hypothetical protein
MLIETPEEASKFVKKWMDDRKVFRNDASDKSKNDVHFSYDGTSDIGVNFSIQQPKNMVRVVGVTTKLLFDEQQLRKLKSLTSKKRERFLKNLGEKLLFVSPASAPGPDMETPEWILFIKEISYDELTEGRLIDAVDQLGRAIIFVSTLITDEFGEPKKE